MQTHLQENFGLGIRTLHSPVCPGSKRQSSACSGRHRPDNCARLAFNRTSVTPSVDFNPAYALDLTREKVFQFAAKKVNEFAGSFRPNERQQSDGHLAPLDDIMRLAAQSKLADRTASGVSYLIRPTARCCVRDSRTRWNALQRNLLVASLRHRRTRYIVLGAGSGALEAGQPESVQCGLQQRSAVHSGEATTSGNFDNAYDFGVLAFARSIRCYVPDRLEKSKLDGVSLRVNSINIKDSVVTPR